MSCAVYSGERQYKCKRYDVEYIEVRGCHILVYLSHLSQQPTKKPIPFDADFQCKSNGLIFVSIVYNYIEIWGEQSASEARDRLAIKNDRFRKKNVTRPMFRE